MIRYQTAAIALAATVGFATIAAGQGRPDPAKLIAAQQEAMAKLSFMDGIWRGTAWTVLPSGEKHTVTQTERVGPFLDGSVKVIEGRGHRLAGGGGGGARVEFFEAARWVGARRPAARGAALH